MATIEVLIAFGGGVVAAIIGSYVTHRYTEHLEAENRRIRTNNVLRAVETEIRIVVELYGSKLRDFFDNPVAAFPRFEEAITGIDSFRQNLELITSQTESSEVVEEIIEMDQVWRLLSAEFRINNWYHQQYETAADQPKRDRIEGDLYHQAQKIKQTYTLLAEKAESVLKHIQTYLANSNRKPIRWIPEEWSDL